MSGVTVTASGDARARRLVLRGRLDESATLVSSAASWSAREVVLDTGDVAFVNSIGIREWMHFLAALTQGGASLIHERCAEPLVEQMSFIPAARGGGHVRSCFAPYQCAACGHEASLLVDVDGHLAALEAGRPPALPCPACGASAELADLPERWFAFLRA